MKTLWNESDRESLLARLERLGPNAEARWGKFTAPKMLAHLNDTLRMSAGELPVSFKKTPFRFPIVKHLIVYVAPWPRGAPTAPELLSRGNQAAWEEERADFPKAVACFAERPADASSPIHPAFGRLSRRAWGRLAYRHVDHHFRQFGA
jgi:Protein of unknown function (DUF1569)